MAALRSSSTTAGPGSSWTPDVSALALTLDRVLDDDHLVAAIGAAGRQRAGSFGWGSVACGYEELYAGALD